MAKAAEETKDGAHWEAVEEATELLHEERFREAILELRSVLEEDPRNPYGFYFLGIAFFEVGEIEAARDAYNASIKLAPGHVGARVALVHVMRILGDVNGAIREGLAALSRAPADPDALHAVGLAYHARGDDKAARKYLEAYLGTNPEFEVAVETKALLGSIPGGKPAPADEDD